VVGGSGEGEAEVGAPRAPVELGAEAEGEVVLHSLETPQEGSQAGPM